MLSDELSFCTSGVIRAIVEYSKGVDLLNKNLSLIGMIK
jgi:hypothetical protein